MSTAPHSDLREFFEQELGELLDGLYGAALRLAKHQADAEDLVAETVTKALDNLETLQDRRHLRSWMFRILTNTYISEWRKRGARPQTETLPEDGDEAEFSLFDKLHQPFLLWWGTPEQEFLNKVLREDLERAVDALPEVFRIVVVLTQLEGFSYDEVAKMLRVPVGTVRSRLARGRGLLQKTLWQHGREAGWIPTGSGESAEQDGVKRKLTAILYADVVGYSRLTRADETTTHHVLSTYLDMLTTTITKHKGAVQHFAGDAVLADFNSVQTALTCAVDIQRDLAAWNADVPGNRKVVFRIGLNMGDVIVDRNDIYGDGVNIAARLEDLADPGGICISGTVYDAVGGKLPLEYEFIGEQSVKNIDTPVRAYRVVFDESTADTKTSDSEFQ